MGKVFFLEVENSTDDPCWIQLFDQRPTTVTLGETQPAQSYMIPPWDGATPGVLERNFSEKGVLFDRAISYACVRGGAKASTAPDSDLVVNMIYV